MELKLLKAYVGHGVVIFLRENGEHDKVDMQGKLYFLHRITGDGDLVLSRRGKQATYHSDMVAGIRMAAGVEP